MKRIIIVLSVFIMIWGCAKEQEPTDLTEISFTVDRSLLSDEYICTNSKISFSPPINWKPISPQLLNLTKENVKASKDTAKVNILPLNVFMDMENSFTCFLSTFESELLADDILNYYSNELKTSNEDIQFNEGSFSHNGFDFHQFIFTKDEFITIKLIAEDGQQKNFMIDYILPAESYEELLRSIESSIGTINKTNNEIGLLDKTDS